MNSSPGVSASLVFGLAITLLSGSVWAQEDQPPPLQGIDQKAEGLAGEFKSWNELSQSIIAKMEYDQVYFKNVLRLKAKGRKPPKISKQVFNREIRRAQNNLPVLKRFFTQRKRFEKGEPFGLPPNKDLHRVYTNLISVLNLVQAYQKGDYATARHYGEKVVVSDRESLGLVRGEKADYYVQLYRHYFYLMASVNYHSGKDSEAVRWLARLEADQDLQKLKEEISEEKTESAEESRYRLLDKLRAMPFAVMPLENISKKKDLDWMSRGLMEVFTSDLVEFTDLFVVERSQLDKVMKEAQLEQLGITESRKVSDIGKMLGAGAMLVGGYQPAGSGYQLTLRLVCIEDGQVLASASGAVSEAKLFAEARELLLKVFESVDWVDAVAESEIRAARAPKTNVVRDLMKAKLLMATKSEEAKELYAKAMREDPVFARRFEELQVEFKDVSATVAVMPFVNVTGNQNDQWMAQGTSEALMTDLPKLAFKLVERGQLGNLLRARQSKEILDTDSALNMGKQMGADLTVLGSVLHQAPQIRIDARFVDIRTGMILFTASGDDRKGDFMACLVALTKQIAENLNTKLSEDTLKELAGKKMNIEDFEKYVRQQLAKEAMLAAQEEEKRKKKEEEKKQEEIEEQLPSRAGFWTSVGTAAAGAVLAGTGFALSYSYGEDETRFGLLEEMAVDDEMRLEYKDRKEENATKASAWQIAGYVGVGVTAASLIYLLIDEILSDPRKSTKSSIHVVPGGAAVSF